MTRLVWGATGTRTFEGGVDQGVLYLETGPGVVWNGLLSVQQKGGGSAGSFHLDGTKFAGSVSVDDFAATVKALFAPTEFSPCLGIYPFGKGLFIDKQPRTAFGLSYRTLLGDDVQGTARGYKRHLVYNAKAAASDRTFKTIGSTSELADLSFDISTIPELITGHKPSAHLSIDSTKVSAVALKALEDILHGTSDAAPRLPLPNEVAALF